MDDIQAIEECFKKIANNLTDWIPEGIAEVDIDLLQRLNLLNVNNEEEDDELTRYFHVIESQEKITLVNEQFVVWIVPDLVDGVPITYTIIALNKEAFPHPEVAFATSGVYNTSRLVLKVLERYLHEILENEDVLTDLKLLDP
ncbi:hypothetical protein [Estrella lausannensis]|uniref:Uncharacterized protein n=1 Tax=Estrella lausannensis TaxID=483423 RepID=A0A0H5E3N6_9BACT|nr:hypothetical protein [Estrella lausannensis]CRX37830.1 conserved hypothetical protein [Estrella lausannensis]